MYCPEDLATINKAVKDKQGQENGEWGEGEEEEEIEEEDGEEEEDEEEEEEEDEGGKIEHGFDSQVEESPLVSTYA